MEFKIKPIIKEKIYRIFGTDLEFLNSVSGRFGVVTPDVYNPKAQTAMDIYVERIQANNRMAALNLRKDQNV